MGKKFNVNFRDVVLENNKNSLHADVIEVDIENRDIKIFMYEDNKKLMSNHLIKMALIKKFRIKSFKK